MNQSTIRTFFVLLATLLFNYCFWQENMGLNTLFFAMFYLAGLWFLFPACRKNYRFWATCGGTLLTAGMIVIHNSIAAKIAFILSAMCAAGFAQEKDMRFILNALWQYARGWWYAPGHLFTTDTGIKKPGFGYNFWRNTKLGVVPLLVVSVFYLLYYAANDKFAGLSDRFWNQVGEILSFDVSIPHLLFVLFGFFLIGAAFWYNDAGLVAREAEQPDTLTHIRPPKKRYIESTSMLGLRQEFRQSLILLWMLNMLLFIVNLTDILYVWFGFDQSAQADLKGYVHEGTYILIASILLAMGVLFFLFRKNLNFFPGSAALKTVAAIWLAQNALLAVSVGIRNWRYIDFHGLAYKRIGVMLFLGLVFFGLITLWRKIDRKMSMFWLWRQNGWAFYGLLVFNACINWDVFITRYNLSGAPKSNVDVYYLVYTVSDKNLFLLEQNIALLPTLNMYPAMTEEQIKSGVTLKRKHFDSKMSGLSWKSWNRADARNTISGK
ncbi:MAG: DUF4173 domain-containing protein [Lewinellaceae bacterium]|nr:DUF4173 domain-containing protein [Lewinellaceae bacterium]